MSLTDEIRARAATLWHLQRIRRLVRARGGLGSHALVSVIEMPCPDPSCPGPATQVAITGFDLVRRVMMIHRSARDVTAADIDDILPALMLAPAG